ncbi:3'-5' exoribonuclease [Desulfonauticus submarinus]|uniref:3'-5' exoribonuclease n=1 Tax=Desulfonauticus submarinus TaxID=206665 RepID=A0A1G9ZYK7_9BACT|nr:HD domain-containing protein [Desulfonauticus submarinus]SDN25743.1 3'-5' exoribonuclease [Desulfonauticus submarinus]
MKEKKKFIQELKNSEKLEDIFVVVSSQKSQAQNGPFWNLTLQDKTGQISARIWSPLSQNYSQIKNGDFVFVKGQVQSFKQQLQINIEYLEILPQTEINLADFLPTSKVPPEKLLAELKDILFKELKYPLWKKLAKAIFSDPEIQNLLLTASGGKKIHHAYIGGLLEHTLSVCKICLKLCEIYSFVDKEIVLLGAALHDLGKAYEISQSIERNYTDEGQLLGHIFLGLEKLQPFFAPFETSEYDLILHLKHLILSHHGELEFGSPKRPKTIEALLLHFADNIDSKVNIMQSLSKEDTDESFWSEYNRSLGRAIYFPKKTPSNNEEYSTNNPTKRVNQCLLPLKE